MVRRARGASRRRKRICRAAELTGVTVPICVVQGETDAMGRPEAVAAVLSGRANASVYAVGGDHAIKKDVHVVAAAAMSWLDQLF